MQDDYIGISRPAAAARGGGGRMIALAVLIALVLGGVAAVWGGERLGWVKFGKDVTAHQSLAAAPVAAATAPSTTGLETAQTAIGLRMAELEQRMTKLNLQADAASGNAARAEELLIAAAARRAVERGAPLGYLADQLKLRFGDSQPNAVQTLLEASQAPVTLEALQQQLGALAPALSAAPRDSASLSRLRAELSNLFVIRKASTPSPAPQRRLERAMREVAAGQIEAAIGEVQHMPGQAAARDWLTQAQRYVRAQRALDLIETAAILTPHPAPAVPITPAANSF